MAPLKISRIMNRRRHFLKSTTLASLGLLLGNRNLGATNNPEEQKDGHSHTNAQPVVVSTWNFGRQANGAAMSVLSEGGTALDAVEAGVRIVESDPSNSSVGIGGTPDREGKVTLDACIMDHTHRCGSVAFLEDIENPVSVARAVMEQTPHVMLVGQGARQFALEQGIQPKNLLTPEREAAWKAWLKTSNYEPVINIENHDTIGMLALDASGHLAGACTTSGLGYKMRGRVGDSPLIGAGLYVDPEAGAATATGLGEAIIRVAGSAMVVELMRQGLSPEDACAEICRRIQRSHAGEPALQAAFIAVDPSGQVGAYSLRPGFTYAVSRQGKHEVLNAPSIIQ